MSLIRRTAPLVARLEPVRAGLLRRPRLVTATAVLVALAGWAVAGWLAWFTWDLTRLPSPEALRTIGEMVQATTLYDAHDEPVFTIFKEQRIEVPLTRVAPVLVQAVTAIEDQRFFRHRGVDVVRMVGALAANLRRGRVAQGGSTITQQLARQSFLSRDKTVRRKLKEILLAAFIEREYAKEEILELYLNKIYFGDGFYGAEAAALGFFGKHANELDTAEAALLAGLIQSPSTYAPTLNLARARARRDVVLGAMLEVGAIDRAEHDRAQQAEIVLANVLRREEGFGLYFKEQVRRELVDRFGWDRVYEGGLRVFTTVDAEVQRAAEQAVDQTLARIESRPAFGRAREAAAAAPGDGAGPPAPETLQAALVAMDPTTGHVRALVGGRRFADSPFNRAVQARRQPGSAFKPFVYAAALESGFTPASIIGDLDEAVDTAQGAWMPEDEHLEASQMTLRTALRTSSNRAAVHLLQAVGMTRAMEYVGRMNVGPLPSVPSVALGAGEVTLQSMTAAYAAFAAGGLVPRPLYIRRVEDERGQVLYRGESRATRAVSEATAFQVANMLADVVNAGTAWRARADGFLLPAAGKTGTTNDYVDAWFVGFTPRLAAGVWVGFDRPQPIMRNGYASDIAVPLWAAFMKAATRGQRPEWFVTPEDVVGVDVCRTTGLLPSNGCYDVDVVSRTGEVSARSMVYTEYFVAGTEPILTCDVHARRTLGDQLTGMFGAGRIPEASLPALPALPVTPTVDAGPPAAVATASAEPPPPPDVRAPEKKRGFWSRIFGRRDDAGDTKDPPRRNGP
jgi:1A family penicillin-binding protein